LSRNLEIQAAICFLLTASRSCPVASNRLQKQRLDRFSHAVCDSEIALPVKLTVALFQAALAGTENVICWGVPGVSVMLVEEEIETSAGTPVIWTLT